MTVTTNDLDVTLTSISVKIDNLTAQINKLTEQNAHVSAELQRLRQIINKGVK